MSLDDRLSNRSIVWNNVVDGFKHDISKPMFEKDYVIEKSCTISTDGYVKIDLSNYKVRSILDMSTTRYNDYRESTEAIETTDDSYRLGEYALHGRMLVVKSDSVVFNAKIRFIGSELDKIKYDLENELKALYIALIETNPNDIYAAINRTSDAFKNIVSEISQNTEVKRKPYAQVKLNRL